MITSIEYIGIIILLISTSYARDKVYIRSGPTRAGEFKDTVLTSPQNNSMRTEIVKLRKKIIADFEDHPFLSNKTNLRDLIPEYGGKQQIVLLVSTQRSGSTFLTSIIQSYPGIFALNEPLKYLIKPSCSGELESQCTHILENLFNCNYTHLHSFTQRNRTNGILRILNRNKLKWFSNSTQPEILSKICRQYPFQVLKVLRVNLRTAEHLFKNTKLNIRVIYLVRDPRGIMHSRYEPDMRRRLTKFDGPQLISPSYLCSQSRENFFTAVKLRKQFPTKFMVVRYEDLCSDVEVVVKNMLKFLNLNYVRTVDTFIRTHTLAQAGLVSRNTKMAHLRWLKSWNETSAELVDIERNCGTAMKLWGYNPVTKGSGFDPSKVIGNISSPMSNPVN